MAGAPRSAHGARGKGRPSLWYPHPVKKTGRATFEHNVVCLRARVIKFELFRLQRLGLY